MVMLGGVFCSAYIIYLYFTANNPVITTHSTTTTTQPQGSSNSNHNSAKKSPEPKGLSGNEHQKIVKENAERIFTLTPQNPQDFKEGDIVVINFPQKNIHISKKVTTTGQLLSFFIKDTLSSGTIIITRYETVQGKSIKKQWTSNNLSNPSSYHVPNETQFTTIHE